MNTRTAYKLLLKCRKQNFWGKRSLVAVRLPLFLADDPPPESKIKENFITIKLPNGNYKTTSIQRVNGPKEKDDSEAPPRYLEQPDQYCKDRVEWWEGWYLVTTKDLSDESYDPKTDLLEKGDLDEKTILDYVKYNQWEQKYIHGVCSWGYEQERPSNPVLNAFHQAASWSKTTYGGVDGDKIYIVYSVKFSYMKRFAPLLSKAMKLSKKHNIKVRAFPAMI